MTAFIAILAGGWLWAGVAAAQAPVILVVGDSLSAAYGMPSAQGWVALLQDRLRQQGYPHVVVNASVSGETSAGGLARLPKLLQRQHPALVLLELGANDGLRGLPLAALQSNLDGMLTLIEHAGAGALLFEMRLPRNYGPAYNDAFRETFQALARRHEVPLVPFFLGAIALDPAQFQDDGLHPSARAQPLLLEAVWPSLSASLAAAHPASLPPRSARQASSTRPHP